MTTWFVDFPTMTARAAPTGPLSESDPLRRTALDGSGLFVQAETGAAAVVVALDLRAHANNGGVRLADLGGMSHRTLLRGAGYRAAELAENPDLCVFEEA